VVAHEAAGVAERLDVAGEVVRTAIRHALADVVVAGECEAELDRSSG
jgi:hypothetical protein